MPFINTKVNISISEEKERAIKDKFGKAIELIGKSETWLMVNFEENQKLYFKGDNNFPIAMVQVDLFGSSSKSNYDKLTSEISSILNSELNIDKDRIYIRYLETENWGWNGNNF